MSMNATINKSHSVGGVSFPENQSINADGAIVHDVNAPIAWAGMLGTRTDDDEGTITMEESAHLVTTGARVDLYWTGGSRRGVTVGTVSGDSVPFSGGAGDNLPAEDADIIVALPVELDIGVAGTTVDAILLYFGAAGQAVFTDSGSVEKAAQTVGALQAWDWNTNSGVANPLTGDAIAKVFVSHNDVANVAVVRVGILYNNA